MLLFSLLFKFLFVIACTNNDKDIDCSGGRMGLNEFCFQFFYSDENINQKLTMSVDSFVILKRVFYG